MTISGALREEAWSNESDLPLVLLDITQAALSDVIRVVNNPVNVISGDETYTAFPFELGLPDSSEDQPPRATVRIDNVSREIGQAIRLMDSPASVDITVVRQDDPDTVEIQFVGMRVGSAHSDALKVEFDLGFEELLREPYPAHSFSPAEYPGLVR